MAGLEGFYGDATRRRIEVLQGFDQDDADEEDDDDYDGLPEGARAPGPARRQQSTVSLNVASSSAGSSPMSDTSDRYAGAVVAVAGLLAEHVIAQPFIVLRRQCQVNGASLRYHPTPFTLLPVAVAIQRWQGTPALFKGLGSAFVLKGLTMAAEDCTSKFTPWPKTVMRGCSARAVGQHLLLKAVSRAVLTPFYAASLQESVQSEIVAERSGLTDFFKESFNRVSYSCGYGSSGPMFSVWSLVPPTVALGVSHYILSSVTKTLSLAALRKSHRRCQQRQGAVSKTLPAGGTPLAAYQDQLSNMLGCLAADALLFPLETVLHRLHLQGTRTLIDNLDSGREVIHIMTRYDGFFDCLGAVVREEGASGLYRGFGALVLQYLVHFAVIRFSAVAISEVAKLLSPDAPADLLTRSRTEPALAAAAAADSGEEQPTLAASRSNSRLPELTTGASLLRQQQHNLGRQARSAENSPFPHQPHPQDPLSLGARRRIAPE